MTASNPFNAEVVSSSVSVAGREDIDAAVSAAQTTFLGKWSKLKGKERGARLNKFADLALRDAEELARLESTCSGIPFSIVKDRALPIMADHFRFYAGLADMIAGGSYPVDGDGGAYSISRKQPYGVCALICAYNASFIYVGTKAAPALAAGNTVIATLTFWCLALGKLFIEAGFPPGAVNIVSGAAETGSLLAIHPQIRLISFTGSIPTGKKISEAAAKSNLKKTILELGGKSAAIVFEDADLDSAVQSCALNVLALSGQSCIATSRLYVQQSILSAFIARLKTTFEYFSAGFGKDPLDPSTKMPPLPNEAQFNRVMQFIESGKNSGAQLITGGQRKGSNGYWVEPTLFLNPQTAVNESDIEKEEIFGPVEVARGFDTENEVIDWANDTEFGLSGAVFTKDIARALRVSEKLETAYIVINQPPVLGSALGIGGWKQSGNGVELGVEGMYEFLQTKAISIKL
ncbi:putative aldehyde dehydrogenase [Phaeomoniella chlamydospora]|uniref:aldehyde dehydrogenase (NAD(+)) n=1 Tax=Phaeomoniella chlamydospora TaxID=158046 RepID=A0A0G2GZ67_PHACM|nr:putative aldehyde dehydrogenase [Phaeomoniella chlamydospora]